MKIMFNKNFKRKKIRLENYDYSRNGLYFVTICTKDRISYLCTIKETLDCVGADIIRPITELTDIGKIIDYSLHQIEKTYDDVYVMKYCIMPDHIHLIISINRDYEIISDGRIISAPTIPTIIGSFKRFVSRKSGFSIWQKSYYDRIIRNKDELAEIWDYIENNPLNWVNNKFNQNKWR